MKTILAILTVMAVVSCGPTGAASTPSPVPTTTSVLEAYLSARPTKAPTPPPTPTSAAQALVARAFQAGNEQVYVKTRERLQYKRSDPTPPLAEESVSYDVTTNAAYQLPDRFQTASWCVGAYVGGVKGAAVQTSIWAVRVVAMGVQPTGVGWYADADGNWAPFSYLRKGLQRKVSIGTLVAEPGYPSAQCWSSYQQLIPTLAVEGSEPCGAEECERLTASATTSLAAQKLTVLISAKSGLVMRRVVEAMFEKGRYVAKLDLYDYGVPNDIKAPQ